MHMYFTKQVPNLVFKCPTIIFIKRPYGWYIYICTIIYIRNPMLFAMVNVFICIYYSLLLLFNIFYNNFMLKNIINNVGNTAE